MNQEYATKILILQVKKEDESTRLFAIGQGAFSLRYIISAKFDPFDKTYSLKIGRCKKEGMEFVWNFDAESNPDTVSIGYSEAKGIVENPDAMEATQEAIRLMREGLTTSILEVNPVALSERINRLSVLQAAEVAIRTERKESKKWSRNSEWYMRLGREIHERGLEFDLHPNVIDPIIEWYITGDSSHLRAMLNSPVEREVEDTKKALKNLEEAGRSNVKGELEHKTNFWEIVAILQTASGKSLPQILRDKSTDGAGP